MDEPVDMAALLVFRYLLVYPGWLFLCLWSMKVALDRKTRRSNVIGPSDQLSRFDGHCRLVEAPLTNLALVVACQSRRLY